MGDVVFTPVHEVGEARARGDVSATGALEAPRIRSIATAPR